MLLFSLLLLFLHKVSCSSYIRENVYLSSNTFTFINHEIKVQADQVPFLRGDSFLKPRQGKHVLSFQVYLTFRKLFAEAARDNNIQMIRNYLDILYCKVPLLLHVDTLFEDKERGAFGLIHYAVLHNSLTLLDLLVNQYDAFLELLNSKCQTALALAVNLNHIDCIRLLVGLGARVNYYMDKYPSLLHYAASFNHHGIIEEIKFAGHDLSEIFDCGLKSFDTPLELAIRNESYESAMILYDNNSPCCEDKIKRILDKAYENNYWTLIQFIETFFFKF
jgi:hypothetical protein